MPSSGLYSSVSVLRLGWNFRRWSGGRIAKRTWICCSTCPAAWKRFPVSKQMQIRIFVGTGGVGKTSVAAASALKTAVSGSKCLVLTIDPARRLRTALGITSGELEQNIPLTPFDGKGELWVALLDVAASL